MGARLACCFLRYAGLQEGNPLFAFLVDARQPQSLPHFTQRTALEAFFHMFFPWPRILPPPNPFRIFRHFHHSQGSV